MWFGLFLVGCAGLWGGGDDPQQGRVQSLSSEVPDGYERYRPGSGFYRGLTWTPSGFQPLEVRWSDGVIESVVSVSTLSPGGQTRLTPGFVDGHGHVASLGSSLAELNLQGLDSYEATLKAIRTARVDGPWITGRGWDQNDWSDGPEGGWPLASDLDDISDRPIALIRVDGHAAWVNQVLLDRAGITSETPDPQGGRIVRGADGRPTGVLVDNAMGLVWKPPPLAEETELRLRRALSEMARLGLTGAHDMGTSDETIAQVAELDTAGRLPVHLTLYAAQGSAAHERLLRTGPWSGERFSVVGVKIISDGALGSQGARLTDPYSDDSGQRGLELVDRESLETLSLALVAKGAQVAVHAIGDAAVHDALVAFAEVRQRLPDRADVPLRIEHAQVVRPEDRSRFRELGVVASMQPTHATSDMAWAEERLGPERVKWAYRWRDLLDAGAPVAFGSDFPVESVDPGLGIWAATSRTDLRGAPRGGWHPDQVLSDVEAVRLFTQGCAEAAGQPWQGITEGAPADLVIWKVDHRGQWKAQRTLVQGGDVP